MKKCVIILLILMGLVAPVGGQGAPDKAKEEQERKEAAVLAKRKFFEPVIKTLKVNVPEEIFRLAKAVAAIKPSDFPKIEGYITRPLTQKDLGIAEASTAAGQSAQSHAFNVIVELAGREIVDRDHKNARDFEFVGARFAVKNAEGVWEKAEPEAATDLILDFKVTNKQKKTEERSFTMFRAGTWDMADQKGWGYAEGDDGIWNRLEVPKSVLWEVFKAIPIISRDRACVLAILCRNWFSPEVNTWWDHYAQPEVQRTWRQFFCYFLSYFMKSEHMTDADRRVLHGWHFAKSVPDKLAFYKESYITEEMLKVRKNAESYTNEKSFLHGHYCTRKDLISEFKKAYKKKLKELAKG